MKKLMDRRHPVKLFFPLFLISLICGPASAVVHRAQKFLFKDEVLVTKLSELPAMGDVVQGGGHIPFSDTYWPDTDMGIAARYSDASGNPTDQNNRSVVVLNADRRSGANACSGYDCRPTLEELRIWPQKEIDALSPAEKFDIANGEYHYPLTHRVKARLRGNGNGSYGICHGWAPVASNYSEPQPVTYQNKDGIKVNWGTSDISAIMSFYYAFEASEFDEAGVRNMTKKIPGMVFFEYRNSGFRCHTHHCKNTVDPSTFHLAITNLMGRYHRSFEVQQNNGNDMWNQPTLGYASEISGARSIPGHPGVVSEVDVTTDLYFTDDTEPFHSPKNGTLSLAEIAETVDGYDRLGLSQAMSPGGYNILSKDNGSKNCIDILKFRINGKDFDYCHAGVDSRHVTYSLQLDAAGNVVSGNWTGKSKNNIENQIGFIWRASRVPFRGKYQILNTLYKPLEDATNVYRTDSMKQL
jgi:hypothetical protein